MNRLHMYLTKDFKKYGVDFSWFRFIQYFFGKSIALKFICWFRLTQCCKNRILRKIVRQFLMRIERQFGIEIPDTVEVGPGLYIGHPYGITVNPNVQLGKDVALHKGVTLGQENRGERKGAPIIDDRVWFGINSTVVGGVNIGTDVLIAPNSFVNVDVPSHSVVFGNPCIVKHKEDATQGYYVD